MLSGHLFATVFFTTMILSSTIPVEAFGPGHIRVNSVPTISQKSSFSSVSTVSMNASARRRTVLASGLFGGLFSGGVGGVGGETPPPKPGSGNGFTPKGPTNEVVKVKNGMKHRRLGGSDILVSELGLGTQRWMGTDFNSPNEEVCFQFMDEAILKNGVNLIDTAEQYPIPSDGISAREGDTERVIGKWMKERKVPREDVVIATKITGGRNITPKNIKADCEGSLRRLQTDYIDVYQVSGERGHIIRWSAQRIVRHESLTVMTSHYNSHHRFVFLFL